MENRPSKLQISAISIKVSEVTEGELKVVNINNEVTNKSSRTNQVKKEKSHDAVPTGEQSTSPERDIKRTASLLVSKDASKLNAAAIRKSTSSESAEKNISLSAASPARKRSSSVEQHTKTQSQMTLKDGRSKQGIAIKISKATDQSPKPSNENLTPRQSVQTAKKKSSPTVQQKQSTSKTIPKGSNSKTKIEVKASGIVSTTEGTSNTRMSKSAGAASKPEHDKNASSRKTGTFSSAPAGKRQHKDSLGLKSLSPTGMATLSPSSHMVKPSKIQTNP